MNNDLDNQFESIEDLMLETAGEMAASFSLNRVVGQLYFLLYFRPSPVSLEEMTTKLKISKGSASVNIRFLEEWGAVRKIFVANSRKDFYTADRDLMRLVTERLQKGLGRRLSQVKEKLEAVEGELGRMESGAYGDKLARLSFYREQLKQVGELKYLAEKVVEHLPQLRSLAQSPLLRSFLVRSFLKGKSGA